MYEFMELRGLLLAFLQNIALFIILSFMLGRLANSIEPGKGATWHVTATLIFSFGAITSMAMPFEPVPGVLLDQRNMILLFAGPFGGTWAAIVSGVATAGARLAVGGFGAEAGAGAALSSALLGLVFARFLGGLQTFRSALLGGLLLGLVNWPWLLIFPAPSVGLDLSVSFALPFLVLYLAGAVTLSAILMIPLRRRAHERALARAQRKLEDILEVSTDWFWETDEDHRLTFLSQGYRKVFGRDPEAIIGRRRTDIASPDQQERAEALERLMDDREPFEDVRYVLFAEQAHPRHVSLSGKPVFDDEDGRFLGYRGSGRDVSATMEAEVELRAALARAEAGNQAKSEFLSNMSHELRTPLNAIIGFSEMMRLEMRGKLGNPEYVNDARAINGAVQHLLELINDILDLLRLEAGKWEPAIEPFDVCGVLDNVIVMITPEADRKGVTLSLDCDVAGMFQLDRRAFRQIAINLLSNSIKFTPRGGSATAKLEIDGEGCLVFEVTDTGAGISEDELDRVLLPFERATGPQLVAVEGAGLGLPISRALAEAHGGSLTIRSFPGKGTEATVRFPAGEPGEKAKQ